MNNLKGAMFGSRMSNRNFGSRMGGSRMLGARTVKPVGSAPRRSPSVRVSRVCIVYLPLMHYKYMLALNLDVVVFYNINVENFATMASFRSSLI